MNLNKLQSSKVINHRRVAFYRAVLHKICNSERVCGVKTKNVQFKDVVDIETTRFFIGNLAQGLVPEVSYFWTTTSYQILVLNVPSLFLDFHCTYSAIQGVQT